MARRDAIIVGLYVMIAVAWVYVGLNWRGGLNQLGENGRMTAVTVGLLGVVHLAAGYYGRSLLLLLFPALLVAIAVPADDFPTSRPEMPISYYLALLTPILVVLTGIGMAARRLRSWALGMSRAPSQP
jgi:hypothetical protein